MVNRIVAFVYLCVAAARAMAQLEGPFELPKRFAKVRFPQVQVADCSLPFGPEKARPMTSHRIGRITVQVSNQIRAEGKDNSNNPWKVEIEIKLGGCMLWRADLDRDGQEDLIVLTSDATSSGESILTLLLIDNLGRPTPWQAVGHYEEATQGLANLVDLDRNGRAELLFLYVQGFDRGQARATSIFRYEIKDARLRRVDGPVAGEVFPDRLPRGVRVTDEPDMTTVVQLNAPTLTITSLAPGKPGSCGVQIPLGATGSVTVDPNAAEATIEVCYDKMTLSDGRTLNLPAIVVLDKPNVRELAFRGTHRSVIEAKMRGLLVQFAGQVCDGGCRPFMMWARPK